MAKVSEYNFSKLILKLFLVLAAVYIGLGIVSLSANKFDYNGNASFIRGVIERENRRGCIEDILLEVNAGNKCTTVEISYGYHTTWISWQFFADGHNYFQTIYVPIDIAGLLVVDGAILGIALQRRRKHTT